MFFVSKAMRVVVANSRFGVVVGEMCDEDLE